MLSSYYGSAKIPQVRFHQIKSKDLEIGEDVVSGIAKRYGVQASQILEANPGINEAVSGPESDSANEALLGQILVIHLEHSSTC